MNIHMYASAQSIAADLLKDISVTVPEHWIGGWQWIGRANCEQLKQWSVKHEN